MYLSWKRSSNCGDGESSIHLRQVEQDGITFRDEWRSVTLFESNYETVKRVIKGPWMTYKLLQNIWEFLKIGKVDGVRSWFHFRRDQIKSGPGRVLCIDKNRWRMSSKMPWNNFFRTNISSNDVFR